MSQEKTCPECKGECTRRRQKVRRLEEKCPACAGRGIVHNKEHSLKIKAASENQSPLLKVSHNGRDIASITPDGVLRFQVAANNENAKEFLQCVNTVGCQVKFIEATETVFARSLPPESVTLSKSGSEIRLHCNSDVDAETLYDALEVVFGRPVKPFRLFDESLEAMRKLGPSEWDNCKDIDAKIREMRGDDD